MATRINYSKLYKIVSRLPKTELHLHLDGSLNSSFIVNAAEECGVDLPSFEDANELRDLIMSEKEFKEQKIKIHPF